MTVVNRSTEVHAQDMLTIYTAHCNEQGNVTNYGMEALYERFGEVPEEQRADVYIQLSQLLEDRGINSRGWTEMDEGHRD